MSSHDPGQDDLDVDGLTAAMACMHVAKVREDNHRLHAEATAALATAGSLCAELRAQGVPVEPPADATIAPSPFAWRDDGGTSALYDTSGGYPAAAAAARSTAPVSVHDELRHELLLRSHLRSEHDKHTRQCVLLRQRLATNDKMITELMSINTTLTFQLQQMRDEVSAAPIAAKRCHSSPAAQASSWTGAP
jgi:hypothetical protein